jgi:hypothetical protein
MKYFILFINKMKMEKKGDEDLSWKDMTFEQRQIFRLEKELIGDSEGMKSHWDHEKKLLRMDLEQRYGETAKGERFELLFRENWINKLKEERCKRETEVLGVGGPHYRKDDERIRLEESQLIDTELIDQATSVMNRIYLEFKFVCDSVHVCPNLKEEWLTYKLVDILKIMENEEQRKVCIMYLTEKSTE